MSNNTEQELKTLNLPDVDEISTKFIDKTGSNSEERNAVGKVVTIESKQGDKKIINYYIKHGRGMLFDPYGMDANKINSYNFQFRKVSHNVYAQYVQYLKTRKSMFLNFAQRMFKDEEQIR